VISGGILKKPIPPTKQGSKKFQNMRRRPAQARPVSIKSDREINQMTHIAKSLDLEIENKVASPDEVSPSGRDLQEGARVPAVPARRRRWRSLLFAGAAIAAAAVVGHFGWDYWTTGRFQETTDDAYVQADTTIIAPKVSGYLSEVLVADNQPVKAGQPLARIDDRDYAVAVEQAKADADSARADINDVEANLDQQQAVIAQARAAVEMDKARLTFTQQDNDRYLSLARSGAGSVQNEQEAVSKLQIAQSTLQKDTAAVMAAEQQTGILRARLAKAEAVLAHDHAVQDQAALNLSYTTIVAPTDGVVGNRSLRVGQYVQAGTQLMAVVPMNAVYVVANFKETQLTDVRAGQPVTIDIDMFPGTTVKGHVDSIAPASGQEFALLPPDNATGNFTKIVQRIPVKIILDAGDPLAGLLRPGMSVNPAIDTRVDDSWIGETGASTIRRPPQYAQTN
jgi:membrane fusion protein (multidrug efflux system)